MHILCVKNTINKLNALKGIKYNKAPTFLKVKE